MSIFNSALFNGTGAAGSLPPVLTAQTIIYDALRLLGVTRQGYGPTAESLDDGLRQLNYLVDAWNAERMMLPAALRETFPLVGGQQVYSLGPGGDFDANRPQVIAHAGIVSGTVETPLMIVTREKWAVVPAKEVSGTPLYLYSDNAFPLANVSLWPVPSTAGTIALYYLQSLSGFESLDAQYSFPAGYAKALTFNLAHQIAPMMAIHTKVAQPLLNHIAMIAAESKAAVRIRNTPETLLAIDPALRLSNRFNGYTGE